MAILLEYPGKNKMATHDSPENDTCCSVCPASVASLDDFYLTSADLATTETTLFVYDKELLRNLEVEGTVMEPIRVMVSNRLAVTGDEWTATFEKHNRCGHGASHPMTYFFWALAHSVCKLTQRCMFYPIDPCGKKRSLMGWIVYWNMVL